MRPLENISCIPWTNIHESFKADISWIIWTKFIKRIPMNFTVIKTYFLLYIYSKNIHRIYSLFLFFYYYSLMVVKKKTVTKKAPAKKPITKKPVAKRKHVVVDVKNN